MAGSNEISDPKKSRELLKEMLSNSTPTAFKNSLKFIEKNYFGVDDIDQFNQKGELVDTMSKSSIEKMKLSHKMAAKIFDKTIPTEHKFISEPENKEMNSDLHIAIKFLADQARKKLEVSEANIIDVPMSESIALSIRNETQDK